MSEQFRTELKKVLGFKTVEAPPSVENGSQLRRNHQENNSQPNSTQNGGKSKPSAVLTTEL